MACVFKYDRKVVIQSLSGSEDGHGHIDNTDDDNWSQYVASYASVISKAGQEFWKVDKVDATVSHVWTCPYSKALAAATPDMRLVYDSVVYEIMSVIDIDLAHSEVEIQTKRAV
jgi:SPP1 family predicted phage head-tail adaptor